MIKPTVGRKVWFIPSDYDTSIDGYKILPDVDNPAYNQPLDATIIGVHSDTLVNLHVIDAEGNQFFQEGTRLMQDGKTEIGKDESYAMWMPYQVTQAAKDSGGVVQPVTGTVV